ncbi:MAG: SpoIIE family protein phosphatase [Desertifilum sp. SIO1I2]|nr:SpoIIE family protein phosphatase [Desertifilum sp. SIO1I2]
MTNPWAIALTDPTQVGEARRRATSLARQLGFNEEDSGKVAIAVTEAANNLLRHATSGQLLLHPKENHGIAGIEMLALDRGPGMIDVEECLRDGFSTTNTSGNGLGAIQRLSHYFEVYSVPQQGTAIVCQFWASPPPPDRDSRRDRFANRLEVGVICLPKPGETLSGDSWSYCPLSDSYGNRHLLLVADGLGHGPQAAQASLAAVNALWEYAERTPLEIMQSAHGALRSTRGAAVAIAEIRPESQQLIYTGVGNIASCIFNQERSSSMISHHGTLGHEVRKVQEFTYPWSESSLLIMHSDGLGTQWRLESYPGLKYRHPSLIAGVLYRDFCRGRDDVTVLVARERIS